MAGRQPPRSLHLDVGPRSAPVDRVVLTVEVDRSRCAAIDSSIQASLARLEADGLETSVAELVADAALYCAGAVADVGRGVPAAELELAWNLLRDWGLRAVVPDGGRDPTLVVAARASARFTAVRVEAMGLGVGLRVATRVYGLPRQLWFATPGLARHDVQAYDSANQLIRVEARGRSNRSNRKRVVGQIYEKFERADFSKAAGVVWFPRTDASAEGKDVLVVDPNGVPMPTRSHEQLRGVLLHYAPFFEAQGNVIRRFGGRLRELADAPDAGFADYLAHGDLALSDPRTWPKRTALRRNGAEFKGTVWDGVPWPNAMTGIDPPADGGCFYWGLWTAVIDALRAGDVAAVVAMTVVPAVIREPDRMFILLEDGIALAWAPTRAQLTPSLFEPAVAAAAG